MLQSLLGCQILLLTPQHMFASPSICSAVWPFTHTSNGWLSKVPIKSPFVGSVPVLPPRFQNVFCNTSGARLLTVTAPLAKFALVMLPAAAVVAMRAVVAVMAVAAAPALGA